MLKITVGLPYANKTNQYMEFGADVVDITVTREGGAVEVFMAYYTAEGISNALNDIQLNAIWLPTEEV